VVSGTATNWLLTCPAGQAAGAVLGIQPGKSEPTVRQYALRNGEFGQGFDVTFSLACTVADPQSLYWSTGTT